MKNNFFLESSFSYLKESNFSQSKYQRFNLHFEFSRLLQSFSRSAENEGLKIIPFQDKELFHFSQLPLSEQKKIFSLFKQYYETCLECIQFNHTLKKNIEHFQVMLKKMNLVVNETVFSSLSSDDIIEVYTSESIQIFRTFNFFSLVNYTLEEIFCRPWYELYRRDNFTNKANHQAVEKILNGHPSAILFSHIPIHDVYETRSGSKCVTKIEPRFMAPVCMWYGEVMGFVNVFRVISHLPDRKNPK